MDKKKDNNKDPIKSFFSCSRSWLNKLVKDILPSFFKKVKQVDIKGIIIKIKKINIYQRVREYLIRLYLSNTISIDKKDLSITWQSFIYIFLKLAVATIISYRFFLLYPYVSAWLKEGIIFFRLHEIYNFDFPTVAFLDNLAKIILLIILGYAGIFFIIYQIQALFSAFIISPFDKKVYYVKNFLIFKELFIFSIPEIDHVVLNQNIIYRFFGIGTIRLKKKSGEQVVIANLKNASKIFTKISEINGYRTLEKELF